MKSPQRAFLFCSLAATALLGSQLLVPLAQASKNSSISSLLSKVDKVPFSIRLEDQFLATLRYLPVNFQPAGSVPSTTTTTTTTLPTTTTTTLPTTTTTVSSTMSTTTSTPSTTTTTTVSPTTTTTPTTAPSPIVLQRGAYVWRFSLPSVLKSQWKKGTNNNVLKGALMRFQSDHGLNWTGTMNTTTWHALVTAVIKKQYDRTNYSYVVVNKSLPQSLKLYINGHVFFTADVNTGISVAPTANGTYPVYARYTTTTMSGTEPNGQAYHDTGIPWVSYFHGGDALHGFLRSQYGYPQSLGCVEMTYAHAAIVWPHTPIGTLVTVQS
jgi:lipoprotein-anchoring transpeptidase ErfK/SrfK